MLIPWSASLSATAAKTLNMASLKLSAPEAIFLIASFIESFTVTATSAIPASKSSACCFGPYFHSSLNIVPIEAWGAPPLSGSNPKAARFDCLLPLLICAHSLPVIFPAAKSASAHLARPSAWAALILRFLCAALLLYSNSSLSCSRLILPNSLLSWVSSIKPFLCCSSACFRSSSIMSIFLACSIIFILIGSIASGSPYFAPADLTFANSLFNWPFLLNFIGRPIKSIDGSSASGAGFSIACNLSWYASASLDLLGSFLAFNKIPAITPFAPISWFSNSFLISFSNFSNVLLVFAIARPKSTSAISSAFIVALAIARAKSPLTLANASSCLFCLFKSESSRFPFAALCDTWSWRFICRTANGFKFSLFLPVTVGFFSGSFSLSRTSALRPSKKPLIISATSVAPKNPFSSFPNFDLSIDSCKDFSLGK